MIHGRQAFINDLALLAACSLLNYGEAAGRNNGFLSGPDRTI